MTEHRVKLSNVFFGPTQRRSVTQPDAMKALLSATTDKIANLSGPGTWMYQYQSAKYR